MAFTLPCVLFAGGKSSRMGRDKTLLPFGGYETLAEYQFRRLAPLFPSLHISTKEAKFPFDAPLILDRSDLYAPTAGLLAVFEALESDFFALAVDTPFVNGAIIAKLFDAYEEGGAEAVIARTPSGTHPMCGIYTQRLRPRLEAMVAAQSHRLNRLLEAADTRFVDFPEDEPFFNMNTPEEYEKGRRETGNGER